MQKRTKWVSLVLVLFLAVPMAGAVWLYVAMNGGIYGIILNMKSRPDPNSPDLRRSRATFEQQIDADFSRAVQSPGFVHYQTSTQDTCYDGANNWKHQDGFAHRCTIWVTNFYGFDGDFQKAMLDFEKVLLAAGWHSIHDNTHDMEWSSNNKFVFAKDRTTDRRLSPYPGDIFSYYKDGLSLDVRSAERGATRLGSLEIMQAHSMGWVSENNFYDQRKVVDVGEVFREVTRDHSYILTVAISGHYFEN